MLSRLFSHLRALPRLDLAIKRSIGKGRSRGARRSVSAKFFQGSVAYSRMITFARFRDLDDFLCDNFGERVVRSRAQPGRLEKLGPIEAECFADLANRTQVDLLVCAERQFRSPA